MTTWRNSSMVMTSTILVRWLSHAMANWHHGGLVSLAIRLWRWQGKGSGTGGSSSSHRRWSRWELLFKLYFFWAFPIWVFTFFFPFFGIKSGYLLDLWSLWFSFRELFLGYTPFSLAFYNSKRERERPSGLNKNQTQHFQF